MESGVQAEPGAPGLTDSTQSSAADGEPSLAPLPGVAEGDAGSPEPGTAPRKHSLIRQAGPLLLGRGGSTLLCFALPLVLTRLFPQAEYGTYKAVFLVVTTSYFLLQAGLAQSLYYFVPRNPEERTAWLTQSLVGCGVFGAAGAALLFLARHQIAAQFGNPAMAQYGAPLALIVFTMVSTAPLELMLTAEGNGRVAGLVIFLSDLVRVPASVVPLLVGWGLPGLMWANVAHGILRIAGCAELVYRRGGMRLEWALFRAQLAYALPFGAAVLLDIPQRTFHQYAVGWSVNPAAFAIYMQGCFQIPIINLLYSPISDVLQVRMAERKGGSAEGVALFHEANLRLAAVFFPFTACMFAAGALFIPALFTHQYDGSIPIYRVAVLAIPFAALPLDGMLRSLGQTRYLFRIFFWKLVITLPAVLLGLKLGGMLGAIAGHAIADSTIRVAMLERVRRELQCTLHDLLPWGELFRLATASLVACLPVLVVSRLAATVPRPFPALCVAGAAYGAVYLMVLALGPGTGSPVVKIRRALMGGAPPPLRQAA